MSSRRPSVQSAAAASKRRACNAAWIASRVRARSSTCRFSFLSLVAAAWLSGSRCSASRSTLIALSLSPIATNASARSTYASRSFSSRASAFCACRAASTGSLSARSALDSSKRSFGSSLTPPAMTSRRLRFAFVQLLSSSACRPTARWACTVDSACSCARSASTCSPPLATPCCSTSAARSSLPSLVSAVACRPRNLPSSACFS